MFPLCFFAFFVFGTVLVLVGANQASLEAALALDLAESGLLASALALGLGVGVVAAGPIFDRYPRRPLFVGAALLAAVALLGVDEGMSYGRWLAHLVALGVGIGLYDTLISAVAVQHYGAQAGRPMLILHGAATLGAVVAPPVVAWISAQADFTQSFAAVGWAHVAVAAWAACVPLPAPPPRTPDDETAASDPPGWHRWAPLVPLALVAFAYVGVEAALTIFTVPYALFLGLAERDGQLGISGLWLGLLAGRFGMLALRNALDPRVLFFAGAGSALLWAAATSLEWTALSGVLFGVGAALGSVYPVMIGLAGQRYPDARGMAAGLAAGAGALGGFAIPWVSGALADRFGIVLGFGSLALWCAVVAAAALWARRNAR
ncbi:MAG: MFS transporter [Myxococcota bacterium]